MVLATNEPATLVVKVLVALSLQFLLYSLCNRCQATLGTVIFGKPLLRFRVEYPPTFAQLPGSVISGDVILLFTVVKAEKQRIIVELRHDSRRIELKHWFLRIVHGQWVDVPWVVLTRPFGVR